MKKMCEVAPMPSPEPDQHPEKPEPTPPPGDESRADVHTGDGSDSVIKPMHAWEQRRSGDLDDIQQRKPTA